MRHVSTLLPFVVFDSMQDCAFGYLRCISRITDEAMLKTVHADLAKRFNALATERWLEVKATIDEFAAPLYAVKTVEEFQEISQRPEFTEANAVKHIDQATYDKAAALVMTVIEELSKDMSDEEKEMDATIMFSTFLKDISVGLADMIDNYSSHIARTVALKVHKQTLMDTIIDAFDFDNDDDVTDDNLAPTADVPGKSETTGQPEANTQGDTNAITGSSVGSTTLDATREG